MPGGATNFNALLRWPLGPAVAVGGALLLVTTLWVTPVIAERPASGPLWPLGYAAFVLFVVWQLRPRPDRHRIGEEHTEWPMSRPVAVGVRAVALTAPLLALIGALGDGRLTDGLYWPIAVTGLALAGLGVAPIAWRRPPAHPPRTTRPLAGAAFVLALAVPVLVVAALLPIVRGPGRTGTTADAKADVVPGDHLSIRWNNPGIPFDHVLPGPAWWSEHELTGLDPATGQARWRLTYNHGGQTRVTASGTELIATWQRYSVRSGRGPERRQSVVDARTGRVLIDEPVPDGQYSSATLPGVLVRQRCDDGRPSVLEGFPLTGTTPRWTTELPSQACRSELIRQGDLLLAFTNAGIAAVGADGRIRWTKDRGRIDRSAVVPGAVLLFDPDGPGVSVVDAETGAERWRDPARTIEEYAGAGEGVIVFAPKSRPFTMTAFAVTDGAQRWRREAGDLNPVQLEGLERSAVVHAGTLSILDDGQGAAFATNKLTRFSLADGAPRGTEQLRASADQFQPAIVTGGVILLGNRAGGGTLAIG